MMKAKKKKKALKQETAASLINAAWMIVSIRNSDEPQIPLCIA